MLKKIARKILKNEIEKMKQENEILRKEHWDLINEYAKKEYELTNQIISIKDRRRKIICILSRRQGSFRIGTPG